MKQPNHTPSGLTFHELMLIVRVMAENPMYSAVYKHAQRVRR